GDTRHDLGVAHLGDPRDRVHDRDRRLPTAGDQTDVGGVQVGAQVDRGHHRRADRRRGQIHGLDAERSVLGRVLHVDPGRGRLEDDVRPFGLQQPVDALGAGSQTVVGGPFQPRAVRVDTDHPARLDHLRPEQLVEQIGADVARTDNGSGRFRHDVTYSNRAVTVPSPVNSARYVSQGCTSTALVHEPGRMTWPASKVTPNPATLRASHATAVVGSPRTALVLPRATSWSPAYSTTSMSATSRPATRRPANRWRSSPRM